MMFMPVEERRFELSFYKNALLNWVAPQSLVASGLLAEGGRGAEDRIRENALFLSRLFKFEFIYQVGTGFDALFSAALEKLEQRGLVTRTASWVSVSSNQSQLVFLADLLRDYLESYLLAALTLAEFASEGPVERKALIEASLDNGRAEFLARRLDAPESLSRPNIENALLFFIDQEIVTESKKLLRVHPAAAETLSAITHRLSNHLGLSPPEISSRRQTG